MLYNTPPFAIVARRSRGITEPKQLEGKKLGVPPAGITFGEWPLFAKLGNIDASKVTIETIGIPVRAPMLAAGRSTLRSATRSASMWIGRTVACRSTTSC